MPNILSQFADNQALFDAVKACLEKQFELSLDNISFDATLEETGRRVMARLEGRNLLMRGLKEIESHKTRVQPVDNAYRGS